jgi:putative salt-induced outer membrane protein
MTRQLTAVAIATLFAAAPLTAQAPAQAPAPTPVVTKITADFGYVQVSGNTQVTTTSIGQKLTQSRGKLSLEQLINFVYGEQNGVENTNFLKAGIRGDYRLVGLFSAFASVAFDRNTFAGIERRFEQNLGLAWRAIGSERDTLRIEAGFSVTQQTSTDGTVSDFPAGRAALSYRHYFTPRSYLVQTAEGIPNFKTPEDWRVNAETSVIAPVSARIGLKVSYVIRYDNLPEPTFQKTDKIFTTGLQISF